MATPAMMHAKNIAATRGYDAILLVYFEPVLAEIDGFAYGYQLSYQTTVAVRSIRDDKLLYFRHRNYLSFSHHYPTLKSHPFFHNVSIHL